MIRRRWPKAVATDVLGVATPLCALALLGLALAQRATPFGRWVFGVPTLVLCVLALLGPTLIPLSMLAVAAGVEAVLRWVGMADPLPEAGPKGELEHVLRLKRRGTLLPPSTRGRERVVPARSNVRPLTLESRAAEPRRRTRDALDRLVSLKRSGILGRQPGRDADVEREA